MVQFYTIMIRLGKTTLEDVPTRWRAEVEVAIAAG
jgi:hypothetical protein